MAQHAGELTRENSKRRRGVSAPLAAGLVLVLAACTSAKEIGPGVYLVNKASSKADYTAAVHAKARDLCGPAYLHSSVEEFTESAIIGGTLYVDKGGKMTVVCASSPELVERYKAGGLSPSPGFPNSALWRLQEAAGRAR